MKAVNFLGQEPPIELQKENIMSFWEWAFVNWNPMKAVNFLGQEPPIELQKENIMSFWEWAFVNWNSKKIHKKRIIQFPDR